MKKFMLVCKDNFNYPFVQFFDTKKEAKAEAKKYCERYHYSPIIAEIDKNYGADTRFDWLTK